jgi:hypothetical protein
MPTYEAMPANFCLGQRILEVLMMGVSTPGRQAIVPQAAESVRAGKLMVSRECIKTTEQALARPV